MNDLHISISYLTTVQVRRIGQELRSDPSDVQPGFYLHVYKDEGYTSIVKYTRVPIDFIAPDLGAPLDRLLGRGEHRVQSALANAVREHKADIQNRRAAAEAAIARAQATLAALDAEINEGGTTQ